MRRRGVLGLVGLCAAVLVCRAGYYAWRFSHPAPPAPGQYLPRTGKAHGELRVAGFGATTLLFDDGTNRVMVDALLTRPGLYQAVFGTIASDRAAVAGVLSRAGVRHLDLLLVTHSHLDHALDVASVASSTGAVVAGSESTREIALGAKLPDHKIRVIRGGEQLDAGAFHIRVLRSRHSEPDKVPGSVVAPLRQPARLKDFKEGGTFAFVIEHKKLRMIVHASANYVPGMYRGVKADVVFLAVGGLGVRTPRFVARYWHEVVSDTGAQLVVPIHWDDFLRPLDAPQLPLRRFMDDVPLAMSRITPLARRDGVQIAYLPVGVPVDLQAAMARRNKE